MSADDNFLSRWSRRKIQARAGAVPAEPPGPGIPPPHSAAAPAPSAPSSESTISDELRASSDSMPPAERAPKLLPPVESLTFDSDFTAFMQPGVDAVLRRTALKTLLNDPRFNVMDGLDVYIDDYSKPDPIPEGWIEKMNQYASLGNHEPGATPDAQDAPAAQGSEGESEPGGDPPDPLKAEASGEATEPAVAGAADVRQESDTSDDGSLPSEKPQSPRDTPA